MFKNYCYLLVSSFLLLQQCNSSELVESNTANGAAKTLKAEPMHLKLIEAARGQVGTTVSYDSAYVSLSYPNGDIPISKGVCTDVVIRAMRTAWKYDLQKEVHLDMKANFSKYPKIWGLSRADRNIDHRRVPNLSTFMKRKGWAKPVTQNAQDYKPGDIVITKVAGRLPHIVIVGNSATADGVPYVIHNIGRGTEEEDGLFSHKIEAHYRIPVGTFK